ncbi:MAG TPA: DNA mismatch repair protein MutS, partial [Spirochaetaceae bacterium]|nr:DNA mismatch repair protein MutS [Spirochaetaceae bacterium]
ARGYIARLLRAGKKVAVCEQLNAPGKGKGVLERGVVELITPGSALDEEFLESRANNYLVAFGLLGDRISLAWADASTGEFRAASFPSADLERLRRELYRLAARELLVRQSALDEPRIAALLKENAAPVVNKLPDWCFTADLGRASLCKHFGTASLKGFGFDDDDPALAAAGAVLDYLRESTRSSLAQFTALKAAGDAEHLAIDEASQKNLEIDRNLRDGSRSYSLLDTVDYSKTAMGARALRRRLLQPLVSIEGINERLDAVEALYRDQRSLERTRRLLASCLDLERLSVRLSLDRANARDIIGAADTLTAALALDDGLPAAGRAVLAIMKDEGGKARAGAFIELTRQAIDPEPSAQLNEGKLIREGWHGELDRLRGIKAHAHELLEAYLAEERAATGLTGLRVKYNRILGYYLELSKNASQGAPVHFIRRQSLANGERYTTERLASLESDINGASERIVELEHELFLGLRARFREDAGFLKSAAEAIAELDCAASLAWAATVRGYTRPSVDESSSLDIRGGRHPVVEANLAAGEFVPNDLSLDTAGTSFALITGPNMAGKSTYLRQNALIVLLAQAGSFVPAQSARIGVADRIFCRVGAQDNLARGESTFLLEMHETASILNNAGPKSLVIMDEVGRGTGTLDGLSIAWAVSEHMLQVVGCRTLFATHYHELTALRHPRLRDLSMAVQEREGEVVFLKRVVDGAATGSYGIHVAGIAGIPKTVLLRAQELREQLEAQERSLPAELGSQPDDGSGNVSGPALASPVRARQADQDSLFSAEELVLEELRAMDIDRLSPLDALNRLASLQKAIK